MDFIDKLQGLAKKIEQVGGSLNTEEATKNALVMPFLHSVLGYDIFDPTEVIPEFTADVGTKKGEKVDYAIMKEGEIQVLMECKKFGEPLTLKHAGQLFRYFSVTNARIAILTNGAKYEFYTDLDAPNKMDDKPFLTFDLQDIDEHLVPEVKKLSKVSFDVDSIVDAAGELKYMNQVRKIISQQFWEPEEEFVKFFASRVYSGPLTAKVKAQFTDITEKALKQFLRDSINERLKTAISADPRVVQQSVRVELQDQSDEEVGDSEGDTKVVTTPEEIDGYNIVRAILSQAVEIERIVARDTQSYFGVLLDDNNRKPLCRLHFNAKQKYLGIFDANKAETRHPIFRLEDIFGHSEALVKTLSYY